MMKQRENAQVCNSRRTVSANEQLTFWPLSEGAKLKWRHAHHVYILQKLSYQNLDGPPSSDDVKDESTFHIISCEWFASCNDAMSDLNSNKHLPWENLNYWKEPLKWAPLYYSRLILILILMQLGQLLMQWRRRRTENFFYALRPIVTLTAKWGGLS